MDTPTGVSFLNIFRSLSSKIGSLFQKDRYVGLLYVCVYGLILLPAVNGIGQFWDWSFPYFGDQVKNVFWNYAFSWMGSDTGAPLPYMSDYYVRMIVSLFGFIPPEFFRYGLLVLLLSLISFGVYRILRNTVPDQSKYLMFASGLAASVNPTMFYKLVAGHVNYLISLTLFVYLMYFMIHVFQNTKRRYGIILGLFFAFIGAQIQFFTFALIFLCIFFLLHKNKRSIQAALFVIVISFLINLPWLSNFLVGVVQISDISQVAAESTSKDMSFSSVTDVLYMTFSKATLIDLYYNPIILQSFAALFILLGVFLCFRRGGYTSTAYMYVYTIAALLVLEFSIPLFSNFYYGKVLAPVFRESGHFGPIIVLLLFLTLSSWVLQKREQYVISILFSVFVFVNIPVYVSHLPRIDFATVREKFTNFKEVLGRDTSSYRVLVYPFFSPYSFTFETQEGGVIPLNNAGNDSFMSFAGKGRVSNLVRPYAFETSPQYLLRKTYDMRILQPYNVRYIFDFSNIYNSEYKRYLPSKIAKENSQILEQDKNFLKNFKDLHPEEITEVSPGIYKLLDASGTVFGFNNIYCSRTKEQNFTSQMYRLFGQYVYSTDRACDTGDFIDVLNFSRLVKNVKLLDSFKRNEIFTSDSVSVYTAAESKEYYVKNTGLKLDIYIKEKGAGTIISTSTVAQIPLEEKGARYFVQIRDRILQVPENIEVYIGTKVDTPKIVLFKEEPVKIDFEGVATFDLNLQQRYLVSFDYKGRKGTYLGYMISRSDGTSKNKISESILLTDNTWNTYIKIYNPQVIGKQEDEYRIQFKDVSGLEYANKKISTLKMVHSIDLDTEVGYTRKVVNKTEVLDMIDTYQKFYAENLIQDGGFEEGTWSDVALCHKDGPEYTYAEAEQTQTDKVEGSNSLLLKSKRAVACVKKSVQVKAGSSYNFSFAYKGEVGGVASYRIDYNNAKGDQYRDSVDITDTNWGMYEKEILVPAGATKATIYLLSRGSDSDAVATHMYDNVHMRRLLYPDNSVYLVEVKESTNINDNIEIWYKDINPTKTEVTITHAAFPFYLGYSESYHPDWKVRPLVTKGGISANPMYTDGVLSEKKHFKINEYFSAWYFNPQEFCAEQPQSCVKNDDGTYTIRLVIEFWPQRWFVIFLTISFLTLGISVISLFHAYHLGHVNYLSLFKRKTPDIL